MGVHSTARVLKALAAAGCRGNRRSGRVTVIFVGRHEIRRPRAPTLPSPGGLPAALAGLRIGLLTDIHRKPLVSRTDDV